MPELPKRQESDEPQRAVIMRHNDRGGCNLCIGLKGYGTKDSYVVITCTEEERKQFPVGTEFDLICVESTRKVERT
jgi:hypothetical protein